MADKSSKHSAPKKDKAATDSSENAVFQKSFDKLIHERIRLGIVSALAASPTLTFTDLKKLLATSDGNLSVHARKLEDAGYIEMVKSFEGRTPKTEFKLLEAGREALRAYLDQMEQIINLTKDPLN